MEQFALSDFNYFDLAMGVILLFTGLKGYLNGFMREVFGLVGLIGGLFIASHFNVEAGRFIDTTLVHIENTSLLKLLSFFLLFFGFWSLATFTGFLFSKITKMSGLGFLNRVMGMVVGGGKYFLIFAVIFSTLSHIKWVQEKIDEQTKTSILYPYFKEAGAKVTALNSENFDFFNQNNH